MNLKEIYDTNKPPYVYLPKQTEACQTASGVDTPGNAQKAITQFTRQVQLWQDGTWYVDLNEEGNKQVITGDSYKPNFHVKGFKIYVDSQTLFADWIYSTPFSSKIIDSWATGIVHPGHITRVWTADGSMTAGIKISLFG